MPDLLSDQELATLPDEQLVALIMERSGEGITTANEMLMVIRDEIPDGITL